MNVQRGTIYEERRRVLDGEDLKKNILNMIDNLAGETAMEYLSEVADFNLDAFNQDVSVNFGITELESTKKDKIVLSEVTEELKQKAHQIYEEKEQEIGAENMRELERVIMLKIVDDYVWSYRK